MKRRSAAETVQGITAPLGFVAAGGAFGIKRTGKPDLMLLAGRELCAAAAMFTTNRLQSAPVRVSRRHLQTSRGWVRAVVCNSGNANASTGRAGLRDAQSMCRRVAKLLGCRTDQVLVCSTGIIGRPMPMDKVLRGIEVLARRLDRGAEADRAAAAAILTTDRVPKTAYRRVRIGGATVQLAGVAKGSGMIAPNLATMLAFLTTDLAIQPRLLRLALKQAVRQSFNRISVDQHTSPSDTVILLASGKAENEPIRRTGDPRWKTFCRVLTELCSDLAYQIVRDGEGATRVFRVRVIKARSVQEADQVAKAVINSPLVKCAVHGSDPNWGRITTAAGASGAAIREERLSLWISADKKGRGICVYRRGQPTAAGAKPPAALKRIMSGLEITFTLDLEAGRAESTWLGCDLSAEYVHINADYTT